MNSTIGQSKYEIGDIDTSDQQNKSRSREERQKVEPLW
jgi:hypothetical protein